jgi:hypothetical protein
MLLIIASHAVTLIIGTSFGCVIAASLRGFARNNEDASND